MILIQITDVLPFNYYPWLMLSQGIMVFLFNNCIENHIERHIKSFFLSSALIGAMLGIIYSYKSILGISESSFITPIAIFIIGNLIVTQLEITTGTIISNQISFLKNPTVSTKITLSEELGVVFGASVSFAFAKLSYANFEKLIFFTPFLFLAFGFNSTSKSETIKTKKDSQNVSLIFTQYPFLFSLIVLFTTLICLKNIQGLAMLMGINELKASGGQNVSLIFSKISFFQTCIIISILSVNTVLKKRIPNWSMGYKYHLTYQFISMIGLMIVPHYVTYLISGAGRKISQHTFLKESQVQLFNSLPRPAKATIRVIIERYGQSISFGFVAVFSYLLINKILTVQSIWFMASLVAAFALYMRKRLFSILSEYQVGNIVRSNIYDAITACNSLMNPEAKIYAKGLISLIKSNPRPIILKACIRTLGAMEAREAIPELIKIYNQTPREDIQLTIIHALIRFKDHHIDVFLMNSLQKIIVQQTSLGELRRSVFLSITYRLKDMAVPAVLTILDRNPEDQRITANALQVLGEIANARRDNSILELISPYLDSQNQRRVRSNAILYLYGKGKFHQLAVANLTTFITSNNEYDKSAVAFLAGELKIKSLRPYIMETSLKNHHNNSTMLISLLKLGDSSAPRLLADLLAHCEESIIKICIQQLSTVDHDSARYSVYSSFIHDYPDKINWLLKQLRDSERDFDEDRTLIYREAITLNPDFIIEDDDLASHRNLKLSA
jgi:hypothetical protein